MSLYRITKKAKKKRKINIPPAMKLRMNKSFFYMELLFFSRIFLALLASLSVKYFAYTDFISLETGMIA